MSVNKKSTGGRAQRLCCENESSVRTDQIGAAINQCGLPLWDLGEGGGGRERRVEGGGYLIRGSLEAETSSALPTSGHEAAPYMEGAVLERGCRRRSSIKFHDADDVASHHARMFGSLLALLSLSRRSLINWPCDVCYSLSYAYSRLEKFNIFSHFNTNVEWRHKSRRWSREEAWMTLFY